MAYASASDVAALTQNILGNQEAFTISSSPTIREVNRWLSSGCAAIENRLTGKGYSVPPASTTQIYSQLVDLNALYAAARVEMSRTNVVLGPGARTRGQVFRDMFWDELDELCTYDLTLSGLSRSSQGKLFVGGISKADKRARESDTDNLEPRFKRGQFSFPGTVLNEDLTSAS